MSNSIEWFEGIMGQFIWIPGGLVLMFTLWIVDYPYNLCAIAILIGTFLIALGQYLKEQKEAKKEDETNNEQTKRNRRYL